MKTWKKWPYWFKGGIVGVVLIPLTSIVMAFFVSRDLGFAGINAGLVAPAFPTRLLFNLRDEEYTLENLFIWVATILIWFVVGAFIGWLYGKIKNRKNNPPFFPNA